MIKNPGSAAAASKRSKEERLNKSVLSRLYRAEAFLEQAEKSKDHEYTEIMVKAAREEVNEALAIPGFWH